MRIVDEQVLALVADIGLDIHDGEVQTDPTSEGVVVSYDLPYGVFYSSVGDDPPTPENMRLAGQRGRRSVFFTFTYVGQTRDQTKWAGERIRAAVNGKRIALTGRRTWLIALEESQRIRRDDDAIRPDGTPLFYGVDNYAVSYTLNNSE